MTLESLYKEISKLDEKVDRCYKFYIDKELVQSSTKIYLDKKLFKFLGINFNVEPSVGDYYLVSVNLYEFKRVLEDIINDLKSFKFINTLDVN